jgi:hypothetical protein
MGVAISKGGGMSRTGKTTVERLRGWSGAVMYAAVLPGLMLAFAVIVNSLIGRTIHWDWVTIFGSLAFAGMTVGRRMRVI